MNDIFNENIDLILSALHISYNEVSTRFFFACPIHSSDNYSSLTIYKSGQWRCFTKECHLDYPSGIVGFVQAVLKCSHNNAIEFCERALQIERVRPQRCNQTTSHPPVLVERERVQSNVGQTVEYYLRRGFSEEILSKYDVFLCCKRRHRMYGRVIFPVYNEEYSKAVGFVGRSIHKQCQECKKYHPSGKPCPQDVYQKIRSEKWLNSRGFNRNQYLFNYWFAKDFINKSKSVILVEGMGDVLKLEMADIHNSTGMFGTNLVESQISLLSQTSAETVYIATDNDKAGIAAYQKIDEKLKWKFHTKQLILPDKDFGEMDIQSIKDYFRENSIR